MDDFFDFVRRDDVGICVVVVLILVLFVTLFISVTRSKRHPKLRFIPLYASTLLIVLLLFLSNHFELLRIPRAVPQFADYIFTLVELVVFSHIFYNSLESVYARKVILISNGTFYFFFGYMGLVDENKFPRISELTQAKVYTVEAIILLIFCICYFLEMFRKRDSSKLSNDPAFWVSTGLLFFMVCTLPYSILEAYIAQQFTSSTLANFIFLSFYILLFVMINKAFLCKLTATK